jgi:hypothetical protein
LHYAEDEERETPLTDLIRQSQFRRSPVRPRRLTLDGLRRELVNFEVLSKLEAQKPSFLERLRMQASGAMASPSRSIRNSAASG